MPSEDLWEAIAGAVLVKPEGKYLVGAVAVRDQSMEAHRQVDLDKLTSRALRLLQMQIGLLVSVHAARVAIRELVDMRNRGSADRPNVVAHRARDSCRLITGHSSQNAMLTETRVMNFQESVVDSRTSRLELAAGLVVDDFSDCQVGEIFQVESELVNRPRLCGHDHHWATYLDL